MLAERVRRRLQPAAAMAGKVGMMTARQEAARLLVDVGTRFAHSEAVASQAAVAGRLLDRSWRSALVDAAWLYDIGYAPALRRIGLHPLDGARWLRAQVAAGGLPAGGLAHPCGNRGWPQRVWRAAGRRVPSSAGRRSGCPDLVRPNLVPCWRTLYAGEPPCRGTRAVPGGDSSAHGD